jgi:hypothetical protein
MALRTIASTVVLPRRNSADDGGAAGRETQDGILPGIPTGTGNDGDALPKFIGRIMGNYRL